MKNPLAFPRPMTVANDVLEREVSGAEDGMTLRDYFAAHALSMLGATFASNAALSIPGTAYAIADAMLAEREKESQPEDPYAAVKEFARWIGAQMKEWPAGDAGSVFREVAAQLEGFTGIKPGGSE